jgi:hypothetical protein
MMGLEGRLLALAAPLCWNLTPRPTGFFSNSDDHLLKNIELFDKLSLRFNGRVLFIKDVIGDEICCWSFYGQGRKLAEVCCTSIVYATEKKQTKVRGLLLPRVQLLEAGQVLPQPSLSHTEQKSHTFGSVSQTCCVGSS